MNISDTYCTKRQWQVLNMLGDAIASAHNVGLRTDYAFGEGEENFQGIRHITRGDEYFYLCQMARMYGKVRRSLKLLEQTGLFVLGKGYFGIAVLNDITGKVIKVSAKNSCDGWINYIHWVQNHYSEYPEHLPKIYQVIEKPLYLMAVMDEYEDSVKGNLSPDYHIPPCVSQFNYINNIGEAIENNWENLINKVPDSLVKCVRHLQCDFTINDCHEGNLMIYKGNLIITDPIAGEW